ncbi:MAG: hypothetical protein WC761_03150 [Candidatus Paceibacterota bacterium]
MTTQPNNTQTAAEASNFSTPPATINFPVWKTVHIDSGLDLDLVHIKVEQLGHTERLPKPESIAESATNFGLEFVPFSAVIKLVSLLGKSEDDPSLGFLHLFANKWGEAYSVFRRSEYHEKKDPDSIRFIIFEGRWCTERIGSVRFCMTPNDQVVFVKPRKQERQ